MSGLSQLWSNVEFRRSLIAAIRGWNIALDQGWPEQLRAAGQMKQIFDRYASAGGPAGHHSTSAAHQISAGQQAARAPSSETPEQTLDRLLGFPSHRLAVYGSLAPGKKNHHMMTGMHGSWGIAVLRGSLLNQGWGAGEGFPGFLWDGTDTAVTAQVFASPDLPEYWPRLDEFEGAEYRRILVP